MVPLQIVPHLPYQELLQALKKEKNARIARNIQIILYAYETNLYVHVKDTAQRLHISGTCVRNWIKCWNAHGLEGLKRKKAKGRPRTLTEQEITEILEVISKNPRESGFEFSTWTLKMIAQFIYEKFRKKLSLVSISKLLRQRGMRRIVPRTLPAKGDPKKKKNSRKNSPISFHM
mgnify:CR=1 FL=1|jgi:transposase